MYISGQPQDMGSSFPERSAYICGTACRVSTEPGVGTMEAAEKHLLVLEIELRTTNT